VTYFMDGP